MNPRPDGPVAAGLPHHFPMISRIAWQVGRLLQSSAAAAGNTPPCGPGARHRAAASAAAR